MDASELIINLVRENECLYSKTNPDYKNVAKKKCVFQSISDKLRSESGVEISSEDIEKRWTSLRDMFSRAKRKMKLRPSGPDCISRKWDLYESMSFLAPHVSHRRSKWNATKPTSNQEQKSSEIFEDDKRNVITSTEHFLVPTQTPGRIIVTQPQSFLRLLYSGDGLNTASITSGDHNCEVAKACRSNATVLPLATGGATLATVCSSSSSSSTTPVFRQIHRPPVAPQQMDNCAKRRRNSGSDVEKGIGAATEILEQVVGDMASLVTKKDPYLNAVEEGLKHVPLADKTKCLIEILQIIDKYQKI